MLLIEGALRTYLLHKALTSPLEPEAPLSGGSVTSLIPGPCCLKWA